MSISQIRRQAEEALSNKDLDDLRVVLSEILTKRSMCSMSPKNDIELENLLNKIEKEIKNHE